MEVAVRTGQRAIVGAEGPTIVSRLQISQPGDGLPWLDLIVPITMKFVAFDLDLREFLIRNLDTRLVGFRIQFGMNLETGGGRGGNQTDDCLKASQRRSKSTPRRLSI